MTSPSSRSDIFVPVFKAWELELKSEAGGMGTWLNTYFTSLAPLKETRTVLQVCKQVSVEKRKH